MTEESATEPRPYLPAMGRAWLLPLYDPFTRLLGSRRAHRELLDRAGVRPGHRVLEIGCGTGTLLLAAHRREPGAELAGIDPDPAAVARARRKAARARAGVAVELGYADALPYGDGSVDRVLSAFMLHHVEAADLPRVLAEVRRVLRPGGELHVLDLAGDHPPGPGGHGGHGGHGEHGGHGGHGGHRHGSGLLSRLVRRSPRVVPRVAHGRPDRLVPLLAGAGLRDVAETGRGSLRLGDYAIHRAVR